MSLLNLTKNLANFKWTSYEKAGEGKSPQQDGTTYFERPNPKSLEQMETRFGQLDTQPDTQGPYGVSNVMDGEKQGRGFIPPGSTPAGFTKNMRYSEFEIGQNLTRTPLSYNIAGVKSNLSYGEVTKKELNLEPQARGAYGVTALPMSTYTSRQPIEGLPYGEVGGSNTYYGNLDLLSSRKSKFQKPDGSYTTPEEPLFEGGQRTFVIPAAYPNNTSLYTIDGQLGWSHQIPYLHSHGTAWRGFKLRDTAENQMDTAGFYDVIPEWYPAPPTNLPHPVNRIFLNSEPNYNAPSSLETQFVQNYQDTGGIWPYKVLGFEGDHPLIRKDVGERYPIGQGIENWMALQLTRTEEDQHRIGGPMLGSETTGWLQTPKGQLWLDKQNILQGLNPRDETRTFVLAGVLNSLPPLFHAKRHQGLFGGETYLDVADFGPLFPEGTKSQGVGFLQMVSSPMSVFANGLAGDLKLDSFGESDPLVTDLGIVTGINDFNEVGAGGRLRYLTSKFVVGDGIGGGITGFVAEQKPFGRPPKIPTQNVFSQKGAFGRGDVAKNTDLNGADSLIKRYATVSYGQLGNHKYGDFSDTDSLYTHREIADDTITTIFDVNDGQGGNVEYEKRKGGNKVVRDIGQQGLHYNSVLDDKKEGAGLGTIKKGDLNSYKNDLTDKVNMAPYGPWGAADDFIKFKFFDMVNKRNIIFRAILSGISDSISPEWTGTRYIGRPDQVYVYQGVDRTVSFNFEIYPKTKQEFPVLIDKLNYLVGLCYPTYQGSRMIPPFINLTLGDMFNGTPGFLETLSIEVDDASTWEIEDGLQFPKHITCACTFKYIGKNPQQSDGKHYEAGWIPKKIKKDQWWPKRDPASAHPNHNIKHLFDELGQVDDHIEKK